MAGDWIKFETVTPDKPEVYELAGLLNLDPDAVVGKLLRAWIWFDSHSKDGHAPVTVETLIDRQVGISGFVEGMVKVGWILRSGKQIRITNFDRHNGQSAKERALNQRRKAKSRSRFGHAEGHAPSGTEMRPEKRRDKGGFNKPPANIDCL